ncbi:MAG TPA: ABC transporter substrate-binding protein [Solirubrobacteraceae bacterium]|jgi:NitT/TauT family transport system substrate-binding protein|nr:ABC transporter substrate-binding protein [Solirubrobacteraceae bacterium]
MDRIAVSLVAPAYLCFPFWIAQENGFFAERGVEAICKIEGTTDGVTTAVLTGRSQLAIGAAEGFVADAAAGGSGRLVGGNANRAPLSLVAQKSIDSIESLRGKRLGTSSLAEGTATMIRTMLGAHHLEFPGDYELVLAGSHPARWEALKAGTIDAALQLIPFDYVAEESGYAILGKASDYVPDYAFSALGVDLQWAEANRDIAQRAIAAIRDATRWANDERQAAARILASATHTNPAHAVRGINEMFDTQVVSCDLAIEPKALQTIFETMHELDLVPNDCVLTYGSCVDETFLID